CVWAAPGPGGGAEARAQRGDGAGGFPPLEDGAGPWGVNDIALRDSLPPPLDEQAEQIERARADRDGYSATRLIQPEQSSAAAIEAKPLKKKNVARTELIHALAPRRLWSPG